VIINLTIDIDSYVGDPYRPERERLINIQKESGMNRARSTANRRKALEEYLRANEMTLAAYDELERVAEMPWDLDESGCIVIPQRCIAGMLVQTCGTARAAMRPCPPEMVRTVLRPTRWATDAHPSDALAWERFAVVTAGTGKKLSNQRGFRSNVYIGARPPAGSAPAKETTARGELDINPEMVRPAVLRKALDWAGEWVGIGSSRKMGWGRFSLSGFEIEMDAAGYGEEDDEG
jgi:hypothetical protein